MREIDSKHRGIRPPISNVQDQYREISAGVRSGPSGALHLQCSPDRTTRQGPGRRDACATRIFRVPLCSVSSHAVLRFRKSGLVGRHCERKEKARTDARDNRALLNTSMLRSRTVRPATHCVS